jgi:hypothetical protein
MNTDEKKRMYKKTFFIVLPALIILFISSYYIFKHLAAEDINDEIVGRFYSNNDLGFSLLLPDEFEYFQTQRKNMPDYVDLEIFIPTSDREYPQEVPGYAKPLVIRVEKREIWEKSGRKDENDVQMEMIGEKNDTIFAVKFWNSQPQEWQGRWGDIMKDNIVKSIKIE